MKLSAIVSAGVAVMFSASLAFAQASTPAPAAPANAAAKAARSKECSKEADAKGLHGKARKEFRAKCKRGEDAGKM
ncbi:MAG TPA: PsiF family protein [Roseiarcus sp.]|nr:PsiF family protein [Roseiarcus sp.]